MARLRELNRNPFEAARLGGLERSFVNDILIGRKRTVRGENLGRLARALDWDSHSLVEAARGSRPPDGLNLSGLEPRRGINLDLFDVNILQIGFSASLMAAGVPAETARRLADGWLEFARKRPESAGAPPNPDRAPIAESDVETQDHSTAEPSPLTR
jgi:hypothetical protein